MLNVFLYNIYKIEKNEIMLNKFSRSLIIWETAIETQAHEMNGGIELGTRGAEQFPHLRNYILCFRQL